jgi:uncharacterized lipoprotein YddW (UPF0748 family)
MHRETIILILCSFGLIGCGRETFTGKREARGVWMSRFEYAGKDSNAAKAKIESSFEKARRARFNMIFFQVRGAGDAFYRSHFEPWSELLSDSLGKDPGWDPLAFAVSRAHRLGLELHCWINTFPIWHGSKLPPETTPRQPYLAHPEWAVCDNNGKPMTPAAGSTDYVWASPGIPAVQQYLINVALDIVKNYDVDGLHFDYIRYPEGSIAKGYSHDSVSVERFNSVESNPFRLGWEDWQREQVSRFVFNAYNAITAQKPWVKVSAAVIGKYMGSGWTSYYSVYQDPRSWMELGKIDFIVPMVYWERSNPTHPFVPLITEWHDRVAYDRQIFPGILTSFISKSGMDEIEGQIQETRRKGLSGVVFFSASGLDKAWETLRVNEFPYWSLVPRMPWKSDTAPPAPGGLAASAVPGGIELHWLSDSTNETLSFVVYRSPKPKMDPENVFNILTITGRGATSAFDTESNGEKADILYYSVSSVDRLGNESALSPTIHFATPPKPISRR